MPAITLEIEESAPAEYPEITGLASGIEPAVVWARIESWIGWRWGDRDVVFIVEGPGSWNPPLKPFTLTSAECWRGEAWVEIESTPAALGFTLVSEGPFRLTGTCGSDETPPEVVLEAARRLGQFLVTAAARKFDNAFLTAQASEEVDRFEYGSPTAAARALQYSGAADLLRPYRRCGR